MVPPVVSTAATVVPAVAGAVGSAVSTVSATPGEFAFPPCKLVEIEKGVFIEGPMHYTAYYNGAIT